MVIISPDCPWIWIVLDQIWYSSFVSWEELGSCAFIAITSLLVAFSSAFFQVCSQNNSMVKVSWRNTVASASGFWLRSVTETSATSCNTALCTQYSQAFTDTYSHFTECKESQHVTNLCCGNSNRDINWVKCVAWTLSLFSWKEAFHWRVIAVEFAIKECPAFAFSLWIDLVMDYTLNYTINDGGNKFKQIFTWPSGGDEWRRESQGLKRGFQTCILHEFSISTHIYYKPLENTQFSERKASRPNSDLDDQYPPPQK